MAKLKMDIKTFKEKFPRGMETVIGGYLETTQPILTKKGDRMLFAKLSDFSDNIELVAFPRVLQESAPLFVPGACILVKGKYSDRNGQPSFVVEKAKAL